MTTKQRFKQLMSTLRLDAHHTTERFGVIVAVFLVSLITLTAGLATSAMANNQARTSELVLYTPTFTTSKTGLAGKVTGVYVSPDRTRTLVLMQFTSSNGSSISANALRYQAYLTATDASLKQQALDSAVTGQILVFGTTGYLGVVMTSDKPFSQQILNLTVRANSQLVYQPGQTTTLRADLQGDTSFQDHDQWRIYVNPGASKAEVSRAVANSSDTFSAQSMYYDLVIKDAEQTARTDLDASLAKMQVDLARIEEYTAQMATTQVGGLRLVPPKVPSQIAADSVTGKTGVDSDPLTLHSTWTAASGYAFDWRSGSVQKGYLDSIVPSGESYVKFLADKAAASNKGAVGTEFNVSKLVWKLSDGTDLVSDYTGSVAMKPLLDVMNNLSQAYQDYYTDKLAYQTTGYNTLINLEVGLKNVDNGSSINSDKTALLTY